MPLTQKQTMSWTYKPWAILIVLLICSAVAARHLRRHGPDLVPWQHDLTAATRQAAAQHKLLLVEFSAGWCSDCKELERITWSNRAVADAVKEDVPVMIDVDVQPALARQYHIDATPTVLLLNPAGGAVLKEHRDGVMPPGEMLAWLGR